MGLMLYIVYVSGSFRVSLPPCLYFSCVGYPAILALKVTKRQTLLPRLHWSCLLPMLVYPIMIWNIVLDNIFFPLGKMIGMVRSRISFCHSVLGDWQNEVILCRGRIGHTHLTHSYILRKDPPPQCEHCQCILTVHHIFVDCNHLAQVREDIFGRRDVVKSFRFHPKLVISFLETK